MTIRALVALSLIVAACAPVEPEGVGRTTAAVVGGASSPDPLGAAPDRFQRNAAVGQLAQVGGQTYQGCSGTVVGDRVVVSAAHCVVLNQQNWLNGAAPQLVPADELFYAVGDDVRQPACLLAAESVSIHPDATVSPNGAILHDTSITILKDSVIATCPAVVPVQINRDPLDASLVGESVLQGGFGALDESYTFSPVRYWSLLVVTAVGDDYFMVRADQHGFPSFGDSGSGALRRFADGSWRSLGTDSVTAGLVSSFVRLDRQGSFIDQVVTSDLGCGTVTTSGICRDGAAVACGPSGFTSQDCTAAGLECATDAGGQARCVSSTEPPTCACDTSAGCDADCDCDPDCVCETESTGGCSAAGGRPGLGLAAFVLIGLGVLAVRRRRVGLAVLIVALVYVVLACACSSTTLVCHTRDAGAADDAQDDATAAEDARPPAPDTGCQSLTNLTDHDACGPGQACDLADFIALTVGCRPAGTTADYDPCSALTLPCGAGSTCGGFDPAAYRCLPFCFQGLHGTTACPGDGVCLLGLAGSLSLCLGPDACDPITSAPCHSDFGALGCYFVDATAKTFCLPAGRVASGGGCQADYNCAPGAACRASHCARWCLGDEGCTPPATCKGIGEVAGHADLGYCG